MYVWDRAQRAPPHDLAFQAGVVGSMRRNSGFDAPRTTACLLVWSGSVPDIRSLVLLYFGIFPILQVPETEDELTTREKVLGPKNGDEC